MCLPRPDTAIGAAGNSNTLGEEGPWGQLAGWACVWTRATSTGQPLLCIPSAFQDGSKGHSRAPRVRWAGLPGLARGSSMSHIQCTAKSPRVSQLPRPPGEGPQTVTVCLPLLPLTPLSSDLGGPFLFQFLCTHLPGAFPSTCAHKDRRFRRISTDAKQVSREGVSLFPTPAPCLLIQHRP